MFPDRARTPLFTLLGITVAFLLLAAAPRHDASAIHAAQSPAAAGSPTVTFSFDPAKTTIDWTLPATLHTVHGTFQFKSGTLHIESDGKASGEIVVDATSGKSGNDDRDKKMHKEVLESAKFSEIKFQADHISPAPPQSGSYTATLHGIFSIHGGTHEISMPVQASLTSGEWTASSNFAIPYVDWGLKNPSTFLLKVQPQVQIEMKASGKIQ